MQNASNLFSRPALSHPRRAQPNEITPQPGQLTPPLPSLSACCCEAHWQLSSECETFVVCSYFFSRKINELTGRLGTLHLNQYPRRNQSRPLESCRILYQKPKKCWRRQRPPTGERRCVGHRQATALRGHRVFPGCWPSGWPAAAVCLDLDQIGDRTSAGRAAPN